MGLTRRQSRVIASALLLSFFVGTGLLVRSRTRDSQVSIPETQPTPSSQAAAATPLPNPLLASDSTQTGQAPAFSVDLSDPAGAQMVLKNFKRNVSKDGKAKWQVVADEGRYHTNDGAAELKNATVVTTQKDGTQSTLTADKALLFTSGQDLEKADLSGHVTVRHNDLYLVSKTAQYNEKLQMVYITSPVQITTTKIDATAETMDIDMAKNIVLLKGNVVTTVKADPKTADPKKESQ